MKFYLFHIIATMSRPRLGLGFSDQKSDVLSSQTIETSVLIAHGYTYTSEQKITNQKKLPFNKCLTLRRQDLAIITQRQLSPIAETGLEPVTSR